MRATQLRVWRAMAQSLVQINAPADSGIHWSLALSAPATMAVAGALLAVR